MIGTQFTIQIHEVLSCSAHPYNGPHFHGVIVNEYGRDEARSPALVTEVGVNAWAEDTIARLKARNS